MALSLIGSVALAKEQQPPSKSADTAADQDQRGTNATPIVVKVIPTPTTKAESNKEAREETYNVALIGLGLAQVVVTGFTLLGLRHARRAADAAKEAADAAYLNAKAVMSAERPHLLYVGIDLKNLQMPLNATWAERFNSDPRELVGQIQLVNEGKTPCQIGRNNFRLIVGELPDEPDYGEFDLLPGVWITSGKPYEPVAVGRPQLVSHAQCGQIWNDEIPLYLIGYVEYRSVFLDKPHLSRFAYKYSRAAFQKELWLPVITQAYWEYT